MGQLPLSGLSERTHLPIGIPARASAPTCPSQRPFLRAIYSPLTVGILNSHRPGVQAAVRSDRLPAAGHHGPSAPGGSRQGDAHASTGDSPGCTRRPARLRDRHRGRRREPWGSTNLVRSAAAWSPIMVVRNSASMASSAATRWTSANAAGKFWTVLDIEHLDHQARHLVVFT